MYIDTATFWGPEWVFSSSAAPRQWSPVRESSSHDLATTPGEPATPAVMDNERARQRIVTALNLFRSSAYAQHASYGANISEVSKELSIALLNSLPRHAALPKVSPDGESGVVMAWDHNDRHVLLTVDEQGLHCVENAGTPEATYYDSLYYDGSDLPEQVTQALAL